jgi:[protein-PII] uridylyltransferase
LRDFQNLVWMAFFKHRTRSLADLQEKDFITAQEAKHLEVAYDFLLRVRNELHYQTSRPSDVLTRMLQPAVAHKLGYTDRSPRRRLEDFMRHYYHHSRNIYLITRTLEERLALLPKQGAFPAIGQLLRRPFAKAAEQLVDGFTCADGRIYPVSPRVFRDQPRRLMRVFLHAQQRGLRLHPDLAHAIRHQLNLVDRKFLRDEHVRETFLEILNQRGNVARILRAMHEVALLGKYIPEFGRMTCLVQHEFYHQYTADEHTLVCLEKLDQIWAAQEPPLARYAAEFQRVERPLILHLAMLLHDAGKAWEDGRHSEVGGQLALKVARRLNLDGATAHSLRLLIEHHLAMASISQRRDLADRAVIRQFANLVQSAENLRMLALHTVADSLATSDKLWSSFKDSLLWDLYNKTLDQLTGDTVFLRAEAKQRALLKEEVSRLLPRTLNEEDKEGHFQALPPRYFQIYPAQEIVADLALVRRFMSNQISDDSANALRPVLAWQSEPDRGYTRVKICTWDRAGLFSIITGSFGAAGLNILSAEAFTRSDNIVLDNFYVTAVDTGGLVGRAERESFEAILVQALNQANVDFRTLINRHKSGRWPYTTLAEERIPLRINFDNDSSEDRTVIEIETEDQLGLLYTVSRALTDLNLDISLAKILTEKGAAIDSFYVSEHGAGQVRSPARLQQIEAKLRAVLAPPNPHPG